MTKDLKRVIEYRMKMESSKQKKLLQESKMDQQREKCAIFMLAFYFQLINFFGKIFNLDFHVFRERKRPFTLCSFGKFYCPKYF